jgi:peptide/nickel transport system substrate-binding protein
MGRNLYAVAAAGTLLITIAGAEPALAQKSGGVLKIYHRDSPASMSILEEATNSTEIPMMGVFNNLVLYKQDVAQNSLQSIVPDLATDWSWNEDGTELTFRLRSGVKWHDGHPFTANDVNCTWNLLLGKSQEKLRANPRKAWYQNVETVTADADLTATFHLKRPQPAIIALLASRYARSILAMYRRGRCGSIRSAPARSNSSSSSRTNTSRWRAIPITGSGIGLTLIASNIP